MPRTATKRKTSATPTEHRSVKRQKQYSTREPPWEEQRKLGGVFLEAGENNWPAEAILAERGAGPSREYLIKWLAHPKTGEEWEPQWLPARAANEALKKDWKEKKIRDRNTPNSVAERNTSAAVTLARAKRNRRLVPDSSSEATHDNKHLSDDTSSPPTLTSRASSVSGPEISETQEPYSTRSITVKLPPVPDDKSDFETIRPSQLSSQHLPQSSSSPSSQIAVSSSPSTQRAPSASTRSARYKRTPLKRSTSTLADSRHSLHSSAKAVGSQPQSQLLRGRHFRSSQSLPPSAQISSSPLARNTPLTLHNNSVLIHSTISPASFSNSLSQKSRRLASPFGTSSTFKSSPVAAAKNSGRHPANFGRHRSEAGLGVHSNFRRTVAGTSKRSGRILDKPPNSLRKSLAVEGFVPVPSSMASVNNDSTNPGTDASHISIGAENVAVDGDEPAAVMEEDGPKSLHLNSTYEPAMLDIHESIEDELQSSKTSQSIESRASSSQESLSQERYVPSVDGIMIPTRPTLGPNEYCFSLPAEGKIKSVYSETIKAKRKAIIRFLRRKGSPGSLEISDKKTTERNEMLELLQRLHNATTHFDLGLNDMQTQYEPDSQQAAAWANYAGSKFVALGSIIDSLRERQCSFTIVAQSGQLQDLLAQYIHMKHVNLRRADHPDQNSPSELDGLSIDLLEAHSTKVIQLPSKPLFILAFDATFTSSSAQVQSIREQFGESLPIIYLLVDNSSEHVERCVPESISSNLRLKIVVRTTFLAAPHLGGDVSYLPDDSDGPLEALRHDVLSLQRAVKKSPVRKVAYMADLLVAAALSDDFADNWGISMPKLQLEEMVDTPPKGSRAASKTPQPSSRAQTPLSRAATPVVRKRLLEQEVEAGFKRQRLTPLHDTTQEHISNSHSSVSASAQEELMATRAELDKSKQAQLTAEQKQIEAESRAEDWQNSLAELQGRYELRKAKTHKLEKENKRLNATITSLQAKLDKTQTEKQALKDRNTELTQELGDARKALLDTGGEVAVLEQARQEARDAQAKQKSSDKSLENMKGDFEFMRTQYQDASKKAQDHAVEISKLEDKISSLEIAAADKRRSLKSLNYSQSIATHIAAADKFALEVKNRDAVIKRLQEENTVLKSKRGVQTRGSSAQPNASPGTRSRQASPAPGLLAPPSGSRTSVLRHER